MFTDDFYLEFNAAQAQLLNLTTAIETMAQKHGGRIAEELRDLLDAAKEPFAVVTPAEAFPDPCEARLDGAPCMLAKGHAGLHLRLK